MFYQLILTKNVQISIVSPSVKSILMKIREWYHVSLTSNTSAKTLSNLGVLKTSDYKSVPGFENVPRFMGVIE